MYHAHAAKVPGSARGHSRRTFVLTALTFAAIPVRAASDLKVIYVGGWDCTPCLAWRNKYKAEWLASPEFKRVTWIEVEAPRLKEAYQQRYWPAELHAVLEQLPRKSGTPRFLIVRDGEVVSNEFGSSKWLVTMAELRKLLGV
ncbi:MAG: hypothetical protein KIT25_19925 [Enhydrobacter sp.]|nr:MAG: hypothetical protein KIT25_19925 [Enhydrobacter sp.]